MARPNLQLQFARSCGLRYGLAATSCAMALGWALLAQRYDFLNMEVPLSLLGIAVTVWYAGIGPAILAAFTLQVLSSRTMLSSYCLRYFLAGSAQSGNASSKSFCNPATNFRWKW
jgi:hypothetical protein